MENSELNEERNKATFDVSELTSTLVDRLPEITEERQRIEKVFSEDPNLPDPLLVFSLSPDEIYEQSLKTVKYFDEKLKALDISTHFTGLSQDVNSIHIRSIAFPYDKPTFLHDSMFILTIQNQGTEEQQKKWLPLAEEKKMIGAYAQTELGHGTDLKKLETSATYDIEKEEFVLNSPTLTSAKCWPGGLGRTSNHALVMAQLYIKGICYGTHMFLVQLRRIDDHTLLPGITAGELGPKMGVLAMDNGFLLFDNIRIPRENMLMKQSQVLKDGTYVKPQFARSKYGTMVMVRLGLVSDCAKLLGKATTISVRYSVVRRQGTITEGGPEVKILDYKTQQEKLFPQVALAYALFATSRELLPFYMEALSYGNSFKLNELHSLAACLKGLVTGLTCTGIETCRRACGGLGYLQASGLPLVYAFAVAQTAYEGDNTVLLLQTARFLIKSLKMVKNGEKVGTTVEYLNEQNCVIDKSCLSNYLKIFERTAARIINEANDKLTVVVNNGKKWEFAWQEHTIMLARCGCIHAQTYIVTCMHKMLCDPNLSEGLKQVLSQLFELLAIQWLVEGAFEFLVYKGITEKLLKESERRISELLTALRPNIVRLVDGFDFCDAALHSVIGCFDGRVYERLFEYWTKLPANKEINASTFPKANL